MCSFSSPLCVCVCVCVCVYQLLGVALLGAGVYALTAPETNLDNLDVDNFLTAPAILLCIIGGLLFLLGFCGCFGALLELYIPLIVVRTLCIYTSSATLHISS